MRRSMILWVLLWVLLPSAGGAIAQDATLLLSGDRWELRRGEDRVEVQLDEAALIERCEQLRSELLRGEESPGLRRELGETLLAPGRALLEDAPRWIVVHDGAHASPGPLSILAAVDLPWSGSPVATAHRIVHRWPPTLESTTTRPAKDATGRLLLLAPFREAVAPALDDPDTLRRALSAAIRHVDLIPRNDTDAPIVRRNLEGHRYGAVWIRALPGVLDGWRPALDVFPRLLVWTLPGGASGARLRLGPRALAAGGEHIATVIASTWATSDRDLAPFARDLANALARGFDAESALAEAQRAAISRGTPTRVWASLSVIGEPETSVILKRTFWLRRRWNGLR